MDKFAKEKNQIYFDMKQKNAGIPGRYESPEIKTFCLKGERVLCQSGTGMAAPGGYDWEDWTTSE